MKKSCLTQELANVFPSWSKTRSDEQSTGFLLLNTLALPMERMEKALVTQQANQYITTANLDEIDLTYRVILPTTFEFDIDDTDPAGSTPVVPTVSGLADIGWVDVTIAGNNDIQSFWYSSIPNRISIAEIVSGVNHNLIEIGSHELPVSGLWPHHLGGGYLYIDTTSGIEYIQFTDNELLRAQVAIEGTTRKGTEERETLVFPWDISLKTEKEWKEITKIETMNFEDGVKINIKSGNYNKEDYLSPWNLRYSTTRKKIDELWGIGEVEGKPTLDLIKYISDEWEQLIIGLSDKEIIKSWELLDVSGYNVTPIDMALQPFSDRAWFATTSGMLYCYDLSEETVSGVDLFLNKTFGPNIQIDLINTYVVRGENIEFTPIYARPIQEIRKYRLWYQTPAGTKYGLAGGTPVAFTTDFWVYGEQPLSRRVEGLISIPATEIGEYLLVFEAEFVDGITHVDRKICTVNHKCPLATYYLAPYITDEILGIEFDSDQQLWVYTSDKYYRINLHTDIMLIDYNNKELYFKEDYSTVEVL